MMCRWRIWLTARASATNRDTISGSTENRRPSTLIATTLPISGWVALNTWPNATFPSSPSTSYSPTRVPGASSPSSSAAISCVVDDIRSILLTARPRPHAGVVNSSAPPGVPWADPTRPRAGTCVDVGPVARRNDDGRRGSPDGHPRDAARGPRQSCSVRRGERGIIAAAVAVGGRLVVDLVRIRLLLLDRDIDREALVRAQAGARGDQATHDDVLLEAAEVVDAPVDGRLGQPLRGLLERRRRDDRLGRQRALRDAEQERIALGRLATTDDHALVLLLEDVLLDVLVDEEVRVARIRDAHAAQHLANDHLDVLVVDAHALEAVDLLDLAHQVLRGRALAEDLEDVVRVRRTIHQRLARADAVAFADGQVLALRDQVLARIADLGNHEHLALALGVLAEVHGAVDLADDRVILRLARLEQL